MNNCCRARGEADGALRLGDIVPTPNTIYPILTQPHDQLRFPVGMRIRIVSYGNFQWESSSGNSLAGAAGGGAPIAAAAGVTIDAKVGAEFQNTVANWANFEHMDVESMQPSTGYIEDVLATELLQQWINHHQNPITRSWTVYMMIGLMIARGTGSVGHSDARSRGFSSNGASDLPGVANANIDASYSREHGNSMSVDLSTDRVWAIRLVKIHKGALRSRWQQSEVTVGAALDGDVEEENIEEVLVSEGLTDVIKIVVVGREPEKVFFVVSAQDDFRSSM
ncbi:uncharacterized protein PG986_012945 [Apiospora aurea]|uniref:Uncharacterized protein n=1 Tax=Apiospora aurea TaxID=335848 RepID=A0ABR1Q1F3_9PEZI